MDEKESSLDPDFIDKIEAKIDAACKEIINNEEKLRYECNHINHPCEFDSEGFAICVGCKKRYTLDKDKQ
jgi:hypothetical protein